jgi:hypothetical protein
VNQKAVFAFAVAMILASACRGDAVFTDMSDSTYVRTMAALRRLPIGGAADNDARVRQRDSILKAYGVTAKQLEDVAIRLADDPARAAVIFRAIENSNVSSPP